MSEKIFKGAFGGAHIIKDNIYCNLTIRGGCSKIVETIY